MTLETKQIPKEAWARYLEDLSELLEGAAITLEIEDRDLGDELEAVQLPLAFLLYDPKDDVVEIAVGGRWSSLPVVLRHFIRHPTEIWEVDRDPVGPTGFLFVDAEGTRTLMTVRRRPELPAATEG